MRSLRELADIKFRQDVIGGNIIQYILSGESPGPTRGYLRLIRSTEFRKARKTLGDKSINPPHYYDNHQHLVLDILMGMVKDLPMAS